MQPAETMNQAPDRGPGACDAAAPRPRFSLRAWLEVGRVSNLPTTWSNVLTGVALAGVDPLARWPETAALAVLGSLFYVGGMAMNDAVDAATDARERRGRPIPSGRVRRCDVKAVATVAISVAAGLSAVFGWRAFACGGLLAGSIVAYNLLHAWAPGSRLFMAACRGLLVVLACVAVDGALGLRLAAFVGLLSLYTLDLTLYARHEVGSAAGRSSGRAELLSLAAIVPLAGAMTDALGSDWRLVLVSGAVLSVWLAWTIALGLREARVSAVMAAIAGMSLIDAMFLCLLNRPEAAFVAGACFLATVGMQRRVLGS